MAIDWPDYGDARWDVKLLTGLNELEQRGGRSYLPVGDGVTDMGATINAAIAASSEGDAVIFPGGTYIIETPVLLRHRRAYRAVGDVTLLQKANTTMDAVVMMHPDEPLPRRDVYWDGITIDGNANTVDGATPLNAMYTAGSGFDANHGMRLAALQFSQFDNLRIRHCGGDGLVLKGVTPRAVDGFSEFSEQTSTLHFRDPYIYDCARYSVQFGIWADDNHILGGDLGYSGYDGVTFLSGSSSLRNTTIWGSRGGCGVVVGASSNQLIGCQIEGHAQHGVKVTTKYANYTLIEGCKIYDNSYESHNSYDGVYVDGDAGYVNQAGAAATSAVLRYTPPTFNYSGAAALTFGLDAQTVTLNTNYTNLAGVASAIDALLTTAFTVTTADGQVVITRAATGAHLINVTGSGRAAVLAAGSNDWGVDATHASIRWYARADGNYAGGNAITFTLDEGGGAQTVTLNTALTNVAGVVAAVDSQLNTALTVSAYLGAVVITRAAAGAGTITVGGADAAALTAAPGVPVSYVSLINNKIYAGIGDFYLNADHNIDPTNGGGWTDSHGDWIDGPGWVGQRHSITLDTNHQYCVIDGNDASFSQPGAGTIDDGVVPPYALRHGGPDGTILDIYGLKAGDTLNGTYFATQAEIDTRMGLSPRTLEPGRTLFLPASGDLVLSTGPARDSVERLLTHGHDVMGGTLPSVGAYTTIGVSFPDRFDTSYAVLVAPGWDTGGWWVTSKTSTGFTINVHTAAPSGEPLDWAVVRI